MTRSASASRRTRSASPLTRASSASASIRATSPRRGPPPLQPTVIICCGCDVHRCADQCDWVSLFPTQRSHRHQHGECLARTRATFKLTGRRPVSLLPVSVSTDSLPNSKVDTRGANGGNDPMLRRRETHRGRSRTDSSRGSSPSDRSRRPAGLRRQESAGLHPGQAHGWSHVPDGGRHRHVLGPSRCWAQKVCPYLIVN